MKSVLLLKKARKMNSSKKPDGVAWDEENEAYIAKLLPYATSNSSPVINIPNVDAFKQKGWKKSPNNFRQNSKIFKIKSKPLLPLPPTQKRSILQNLNLNPSWGKVTTFMQGKNGENFLSLIAPSDWNKKHLGTFRLNGEYKWERQN